MKFAQVLEYHWRSTKSNRTDLTTRKGMANGMPLSLLLEKKNYETLEVFSTFGNRNSFSFVETIKF